MSTAVEQLDDFPKYVVLTNVSDDELSQLAMRQELEALEISILEPDTYFVLKSSDLFGAPALYGYAHILQTALETDRSLTDSQRTYLEVLAELAVKTADGWKRRGEGRVPD